MGGVWPLQIAGLILIPKLRLLQIEFDAVRDEVLQGHLLVVRESGIKLLRRPGGRNDFALALRRETRLAVHFDFVAQHVSIQAIAYLVSGSSSGA